MLLESIIRWQESMVQRKHALEVNAHLAMLGAQMMAPPEDPFAPPRVRAKS
jgi:hypothetical protein